MSPVLIGVVHCMLEKLVTFGTVSNRNLLMGDPQAHTLKRKLLATERFENESAVKQYLKERCLVQIFQLADEKERSFFEHFTIAILKPEYND
ncbi:MAG: hypothetical protein GWN40_05395 [Nitrosopumilaceae archaeon]|nr:hypothetical protein [Nitrosopumilaceae archaeon]